MTAPTTAEKPAVTRRGATARLTVRTADGATVHDRDDRIDLLRAAATLFILLHHADDYGIEFLRLTPFSAALDDALTWIALTVFFAVSGFLAVRPVFRTSDAGWPYVRRRFVRLYPPFAAACVLFWMSGAFPLSARTVTQNLALLGPWTGDELATLWFVEVLLFYQVVFGLWAASERLRQRPWTLPALTGLVAVACALVARTAGLEPDSRVLLYLPAFAGAAAFASTRRIAASGSRRVLSLAQVASATLLVVVAAVVASAWNDPLAGLAASATTALAVCWVLGRPPSARARHTGPGAITLGVQRVAYGSFMAYVSHRIVFSAAARLAEPLGTWAVTLAVLACVPVVLVLGHRLQGGYDALLGRARNT